ncbi:carbohydrate esterase family 16 protein [Xylariomycetidae sp. FL2044]|nr:carbohydrate esterase family 16 protein [Xylariomycetidae sp. FL2044]
MVSFISLFLVGVTSTYALSDIKNLIVFGDSYTDEGRLSWFTNHNGTGPPPGTDVPTSDFTASGGYTWPYYASQQLGAKTYNYAVSGAVCSNDITPRWFSGINALFPSVADYEVPAFLDDVAFVNTTTGENTLYPDRDANNSVYALWIGTNDLGLDAFLTDSQLTGATLTDFAECIWTFFDDIYGTGGRQFVLFNEAPLETSPLYAAPQNQGTGNNTYWTDKTAYNTTEYEQKMREYTTSVNTIFEYGLAYHANLENRWPGAAFSILNVHDLIRDIVSDPESYLDEPANATGYYHQCGGPDFDECTDSEYPLTSFLWYDELHPSTKADEIIASEFVKLLDRGSTYGKYY